MFCINFLLQIILHCINMYNHYVYLITRIYISNQDFLLIFYKTYKYNFITYCFYASVLFYKNICISWFCIITENQFIRKHNVKNAAKTSIRNTKNNKLTQI